MQKLIVIAAMLQYSDKKLYPSELNFECFNLHFLCIFSVVLALLHDYLIRENEISKTNI